MSLIGSPNLYAETVDHDMINKIRDEGFNRSEVLQTFRVLTDEIGPRLTASPGMRAASKWTVEQLEDWGLANVRLEAFEFGRGWSAIRSEIHMTSPRRTQLYGLPVQWHPGTDGLVEADIVYAPMKETDDFAAWAGDLTGKIVLISDVGEPSSPAATDTSPYQEEDLAELTGFKIPVGEPGKGGSWKKFMDFRRALMQFLDGEDIAVKTMQILFELAHGDRLDRIENRDHLWALLRSIAKNRAINEVDAQKAEKRGSGKVQGGSAAELQNGAARPVADFHRRFQPGELESMLKDAYEAVESLEDERQRTIASLTLQGLSAFEIGEALNVSKRLVERERNQIGTLLQKER